MTTVYQYKIYCNTEHNYVYGWGLEAPTVCYNNQDHVVNLDSIQIERTITGDESESTFYKNHDKFNIIPISITAPPDQTTVINITFKYSVNVHFVKFTTNSDHLGDLLSAAYNPDTIIGVTTSTVLNDTNTLAVNSTVLENIIVGYYVKITDDVNTSDLGVCVAVDSVLGTITTDLNTTYEFSAGSKIVITYYLLHEVPLGHAGLYVLGESVQNKPILYRGMTGRVTYTNYSPSVTKRLIMYMECTV